MSIRIRSELEVLSEGIASTTASPLASTTTTKHLENMFSSSSSSSKEVTHVEVELLSSSSHRPVHVQSAHVVLSLLLRIRQHGVGLIHVLEGLLSLGLLLLSLVLVLVRVPQQGLLSESLLDLLRSGVLGNSKRQLQTYPKIL